MPRFARHRVGDHEIIAGQMREAAEVHGVAELVAAGLESLVATRCHDEQIADRPGFRQLLPEREPHRMSTATRIVPATGLVIGRA